MNLSMYYYSAERQRGRKITMSVPNWVGFIINLFGKLLKVCFRATTNTAITNMRLSCLCVIRQTKGICDRVCDEIHVYLLSVSPETSFNFGILKLSDLIQIFKVYIFYCRQYVIINLHSMIIIKLRSVILILHRAMLVSSCLG